jgi:hypothetical protein
MKCRGKLVLSFDGSGKILPQFTLEGGEEFLQKINEIIK